MTTNRAQPGGFQRVGAVAAALLGIIAALLALVTVGVVAAVVAGLVIAALTYGVAALAGRGRRELPGPAAPRVRKGSPAEVWLHRAEKAVATLQSEGAGAQGAVLRDQVAGVDSGAGSVLEAMRRLAVQVTAVEDALYRIDEPRLRAERDRIGGTAPAGPEAQSRAAVTDQLAVAERLRGTRETLLSRMQSSALGLEGLVARLAEVLALAETAGGVDPSQQQIGQLADELDGLRAGLIETEALSRKALGPG